MKLKNNTIHVWTGSLAANEQDARRYLPLLSTDEQARAERFQFEIHRLRYITAHYQLRIILSKYLGIDPIQIQFAMTEHKKPYLSTQHLSNIEFNISHSGDMAVFAIGQSYPLGIDIEKVQDEYKIDVADRFFSDGERGQLLQLKDIEKRIGFFRIWSRKEAIIKATGKGLSQRLSSFSVSAHDITETIQLDNESWQLMPISVGTGYQAALACHPSIEDVDIFSFEEMIRK